MTTITALRHVLHGSAILLAYAVMVGGCAAPTVRPRDGALPRASGTPGGNLLQGAPATLEPAAGLRGTPTVGPSIGSPLPSLAASPVRSPGVYPVISNLQPAPGAAVPPGDVVIGARITGASDILDVLTFVNGEPFRAPLGTPPSRTAVISFVRQFSVGTQEVRIEVRDEQGQTGGYRWQFSVGPREPLPTIQAPSLTREAGTPRATASPMGR